MMFGTLSGKIISDQILGIENRYSDLYSPSRIKPIAGFSEFVKENADVAWRFIADRFGAEEDLDSLKQLAPEKGIIAELKGEKVAIYKDAVGKLTALNPTCTHAGCIVSFNDAEKSWDCPCHGGRFDVNGKVVTGPPRKDLEKIPLGDNNQ
jgi:nitrite reductase/ring-hydroxylating ferredoxin subunit